MLCPVPTTLLNDAPFLVYGSVPPAQEVFPEWPVVVLAGLFLVLAIAVVVMECMRMRKPRR